MILTYITWDVNPEIFRIGSFAVRYYGVLWALAFYFGYLIFDRFVKRESLPEGYLDSLTIYSAVGIVLGARLGHCLFYDPMYYLSNPLDIIKIWEGGLASHGAAIGAVIGLYLFSRKAKKPLIHALDRFMIPAAFGGALVRIGNLMNSEIYGIETTKPWGFIFLRDGQLVPKHPTQIYEALSYFVIFGILYLVYTKSKAQPKPGLLFGLFMLLVFCARFFIEYVKEPQVAFEVGMKLNMGQILSIPFILAGLGFIGWSLRKRNL
jgi:prolipoprotein diacylglyceryl transferase